MHKPVEVNLTNENSDVSDSSPLIRHVHRNIMIQQTPKGDFTNQKMPTPKNK